MSDEDLSPAALMEENQRLRRRLAQLEGRSVFPEAEETLRLLVEHTPAAVAMFDTDMRYVLASRRWIADYGLDDADIIGKSHYDIFPEIPERWRNIHRRCLAGESMRVEEDSFIRTDGSTDWVRWEIIPWHEADGSVGGIIMFTEVITRRKRAELARRRAEETFRTIFDNAPVGLFRCSPSGRPMAANPALARMCGFDSSEQFLAEVENIVDDLFAIPAQRKEIFRTIAGNPGLACFENLYRKRDGSVFLGRANVRVVHDEQGTPLYVEGLVEDITEAKRMEQRLREQGKQLQDILDNAASAIFVKNLQGRFILANEPFSRLSGRSVKEIIGQTSADIFAPDYAAKAMENDQRVMDTKQAVWHETSTEIDGKERTFITTKFPLLDSDGDVYAVGAILTDITDRKQAEEERRRTLALREEVERMARHDLKSPLIAIVGFSRLLAQSDNLTEQQTEMLHMIQDAGRRMQQIIDLSMAMHQMEAGEYALQAAELDLAALVRRISAGLDDLAGRRGRRVNLNIDGLPAGSDQAMAASGEEFLLESLLSNLIKNALEASPEGRDVEVDLSPGPGGGVVIEVRNAGAVPEAMRERFFDKYATHGKRHGSGLGTHIARLIARTHGGDMAMETSEETGTTVTVTLPG